jgi:vacuolar-type H+-ATPase subunit C/Vma6
MRINNSLQKYKSVAVAGNSETGLSTIITFLIQKHKEINNTVTVAN